MRFAKILNVGKTRADVSTVGNMATGGTWNNPTAIYTPRFVRWNLTVDF